MDTQAYIQSGILESYVLGLATAEEIAEVEAMKLQYPEVEKAMYDFIISLEREAIENGVTPPAEVKDRIMSAIKDEDFAAPVVNIGRDNEEHLEIALKTLRPWRMMAAASVILLIVSAAFNFYLYNQYDNKNEAYQALLSERNTLQANNQLYQTHLHEWENAAAMMADPAMATVKMKGIPGKEANMATIFWDTRNKDVYVMPNKLQAPSPGKQYQLWAIVDGKPVDAGILDQDCNGVCKMKNIPKAEAFAITLENAGGSSAPTLTAMFVQGIV
ncbi:MAG TPA: anti-sigma factor [Segetibacter sp.]